MMNEEREAIPHSSFRIPHLNERGGSSLAFAAVVFATIFVPLLALSADLPRLMWTLDHLQTAADAAAEAGAYGGVDVDHYQRTGDVRYLNGTVNYLAMTTFDQAVGDAGLIQYSPRIAGIQIDESDDTVLVTAEATVRIFFPEITPPITIRVSATSQTRAAQGR